MASVGRDGGRRAETMRLSVSLPRDVYQALESKASTNDVSLAWVVRKAVVDYLDQDIPLLRVGD
jgi:metal-responsive CopG/Arc/MetJ family transcriptional regulator